MMLTLWLMPLNIEDSVAPDLSPGQRKYSRQLKKQRTFKKKCTIVL